MSVGGARESISARAAYLGDDSVSIRIEMLLPSRHDATESSDEEFLETVWEQVSGLVVLLATDLWHFLGTLHSSSGEAIDTTHLSVRIGLEKKLEIPS